jgi:hypothetical protein
LPLSFLRTIHRKLNRTRRVPAGSPSPPRTLVPAPTTTASQIELSTVRMVVRVRSESD